EEILKWVFLYQPVPVAERPADAPMETDAGTPMSLRAASPAAAAPRSGPTAAAPARASEPPRVREPELAMVGARSLPRNLTFNDPAEAPSAFAKAERPEAHGGAGE